MKKVPKRRFKGFLNAGDWEQRKLISCIQKVIDFRGRTPNKLGMEWSCSGHLALSALNVKDGYIDFSQDNHYGDNDLYEKWMTGNELHKGQVVFTTEAPMGNVAQIPDNERYILSQRTVAFCVDENIITENFLAVLLRTPVVFKTLTKLSSGGTAQGISQKSLAEIEVRIPPNLHEQQIISNFLLSFEHCITLHQRKLEKLQATKKALLYELFPIENSRRPKLRFKGFTGDWEQRKLGELLEQPITDGPHETPELYDSGIPFISVDAIVDNKIDFTKMRGYISKEYDDICAKKYKPQINDVYLVKSGATIGKVAIVDTYDDFNIWSPLAAMRCGSITNPYFLYVLLQTKDLQTQVFNKASHGTQPNLSMRQLETFTCKVPKIEEQILISQFFKRLNDSITLHQRKLEKLKNLKAAYLNEMFV